MCGPRLADRLEAAAVDAATAQGWTWAEIADELNLTRQGAHKRHAQRLASKRRRRSS